MSNSFPNQDSPRRVLLATDLSARGDRALERAIVITAAYKAQLTILHVYEEFEESTLSYRQRHVPSWKASPDAAATAKLRIEQGLREDLGGTVAKATIRIEQGEPAEVIEGVAESEGTDLIVTGIAREGPFAARPVILGKTVEQLLRRVPTPILIVKNRARSSYGHVLVTTDFSLASAHALQAALRFFPLQSLHLLHAFRAPYAGLVSDPHGYSQGYRETSVAELEEFLDSIFLPEADRRRLVTLIEPGEPAQLVRDYVRDHGADLVVLGTHGHGAMLEALFGSTAKGILSTLPCDALVVRGPRSRAPSE